MDDQLRLDIAEIRDNSRRMVELFEQLVARKPRKLPEKREPFVTEADYEWLREQLDTARRRR